MVYLIKGHGNCIQIDGNSHDVYIFCEFPSLFFVPLKVSTLSRLFFFLPCSSFFLIFFIRINTNVSQRGSVVPTKALHSYVMCIIPISSVFILESVDRRSSFFESGKGTISREV